MKANALRFILMVAIVSTLGAEDFLQLNWGTTVRELRQADPEVHRVSPIRYAKDLSIAPFAIARAFFDFYRGELYQGIIYLQGSQAHARRGDSSGQAQKPENAIEGNLTAPSFEVPAVRPRVLADILTNRFGSPLEATDTMSRWETDQSRIEFMVRSNDGSEDASIVRFRAKHFGPDSLALTQLKIMSTTTERRCHAS